VTFKFLKEGKSFQCYNPSIGLNFGHDISHTALAWLWCPAVHIHLKGTRFVSGSCVPFVVAYPTL